MCVDSLIAVYLFYPETQGLHLEAIDQIFLDSKNFLEPVRAARRIRAESSKFVHSVAESTAQKDQASDIKVEGNAPA